MLHLQIVEAAKIRCALLYILYLLYLLYLLFDYLRATENLLKHARYF